MFMKELFQKSQKCKQLKPNNWLNTPKWPQNTSYDSHQKSIPQKSDLEEFYNLSYSKKHRFQNV
jgi:hypothetical protein